MDPTLLLFILRLVSALALLAFLGLIGWYLYRDLELITIGLARQAGRQAQLRVLANREPLPAVDTVFPLAAVNSIGRSPSSSVVIANNYASSEHALLTWRGGQWLLEDLGSRNGTLLNSIPVEGQTVISAGDIITIGETQLKLEF